jgi:hypothetical protein
VTLVDRHDNDASEQATPQADNPFGAVFAPEDQLLVFADAFTAQARGEGVRSIQHLFV